jgi:glycosyltransferase involved in cell wall biosynthesis
VTYVGHMASGLRRLGLDTSILTAQERSGIDGPEPPVDCPPGEEPAQHPPAAVDLGRVGVSGPHALLDRALDRIPRLGASGLSFGWSVARGIAALERRASVDLLEMEESFGAALYAQEVSTVPIVVRLHGPWFLNGAALGVPTDTQEFARRDRAEARCIADARAVTSPSRDLLERVRSRYGLALEQAAVIPNPAPVIPLASRWRADRADRNTVLFVGRFDRHKGGDLVVEAFGRLAARIPEARLIFVGPDRGLRDDAGVQHDLAGYLEAKLPPAARARVQVRGPLQGQQIEPLRREAFVTVVASRYENFSLALVEALSFGCPTVAARVGGNPEILRADETGVLVPGGDAEALAAGLQALIEEPERAARLGGAAALDMAERLQPDAIARLTRDFYEAVLDRPGPPSPPRAGRGLRRVVYRLGTLTRSRPEARSAASGSSEAPSPEAARAEASRPEGARPEASSRAEAASPEAASPEAASPEAAR